MAGDIQSLLTSSPAAFAERLASLRLDSALAGLPVADALQRDFGQWQSIVEEFRTAILEEPRRPVSDVVGTTLRGIFEAATNIDTDLDSPHKKVAFWVGLLLLIWHLSMMVGLSQKQALADADAMDRRRVQREHADAIAALTDALQTLKAQSAEARASVPHLRVKKQAIVRDGPSGTSRRVVTLASGRSVRLVSSFDRWCYIEILDSQLRGTGVTGWIYGRNLRTIGSMSGLPTVTAR
jgi:hypothetical protein